MVPWIMGYPEVMLRNKLFNYAGQNSACRKSPGESPRSPFWANFRVADNPTAGNLRRLIRSCMVRAARPGAPQGSGLLPGGCRGGLVGKPFSNQVRLHVPRTRNGDGSG